MCSLVFQKTFFGVELSFFLKVQRSYFGQIVRFLQGQLPKKFGKTLKMIKNAFYFILRSLFVLTIFKFLS